MKPRPRVRFCWVCGNKLWAGKFVEAKHKGDGHVKILHRECFRYERDLFEEPNFKPESADSSKEH